MNAKKISILFFLLFMIFNLLYSINIYKNDEHGISFEYPDEVIFDELNKYYMIIKYSDEVKDINEKYILNVQFNTFKDFFKFSPLKLKEKDMNEKNVLKIFIKESSNNKINYSLLNYNNKIIGDKFRGYLGINQTEVNQYYVCFSIVKDEYIIGIGLTYYDLLTQIPPKYPDYFKKDDIYNEWVFKWNGEKPDISDKFFNLAITHSDKAVPELVKLFDYADIIEKSLKFYGKMLTPKITNLVFREKPDKNSKVIRILNINEKLELIEKGKEETINGVKGTWIKVKTEKGEVGWCFDAYLKEVK